MSILAVANCISGLIKGAPTAKRTKRKDIISIALPARPPMTLSVDRPLVDK